MVFKGRNLYQNDPIFYQKPTHRCQKIFFSQKPLFFLKTYSDSSLNTKYEGLTRKSERDILKKRSEISDFDHFPLFTVVSLVNPLYFALKSHFSSKYRNSELRGSWLGNQNIGPFRTSPGTTFPHLRSTLETF